VRSTNFYEVHFSKETHMASKAKTIGSTDSTQPGTAVGEKERLPPSTGEQEIRDRAYQIYLERGAQPGNELEDWLQAKRELTT
jgi:hypothetical protein